MNTFIIAISYLLVLIGSVSAGGATYLLTDDPAIGILIFSATLGLFGGVLPSSHPTT